METRQILPPQVFNEFTVESEKVKKNKGKLLIAVDFDGTIVTHAYPLIGKDIGAFDVLNRLQDMGALIILNTIRSGSELTAAIDFCKSMGLIFYGINSNPEQKAWSDSPKVYANIYIDDAALGCPLKFDAGLSYKPFADWEKISRLLEIRIKILNLIREAKKHKEFKSEVYLKK